MNDQESAMPVFESKEPGVPPEVAEARVTGTMTPASPRALAKLRKPKPVHFPAARGLVLGWCLWLLGSWAVLLPMEGPVWAVRGMIVLAVVGLMAIWPLVRLSQTPAEAPPPSEAGLPPREAAVVAEGSPGTTAAEDRLLHLTRPRPVPQRWIAMAGVMFEWLSLMAVFQAVVWPLRVTADWSLAQALWLDGAVASWSLLTGALIALGIRMGAAGRSAMMALCLLLLLAEPVLAAVWPGGWEMRVCPIPTVWALTGPSTSWHRDPWAGHIIAASIAAIVAWCVVMVSILRQNASRPDATTAEASRP